MDSQRSTTKKRKYENDEDDIKTFIKKELGSFKQLMLNQNLLVKMEIDSVYKKHTELQNEIIALKATFLEQLERMTGILASQNTLLDQISKNMFARPKYFIHFPIQTQSDLDAMEAMISDESKSEMIATIEALLKNGGLEKNMASILSTELILDYNLDGKQHKKRLQNYPNLMAVLYGATRKDGLNEQMFLTSLRKGLKNVKNRHHKNVCVNKDRTNQNI